MAEGLWVQDPLSNEDIYITYEELEQGVRQLLIKPIGGFIFPADDFIASENFADVPFYIKDWLPQLGKLLFYAPAKAGKSFLAVQMARCIGSEEYFLGMPTVQGRVLYIQFELGESILHKRMTSSGFSYPNVFVGTSFSMKIDMKAGQEQLLRAMEAVKPNVLILDPLYKCLAGDENEAAEVRKALDFLDGLIEQFHCSIVVIHHAGKDLSKRGRGSSVIEDWVDSFVRITSKTENKKLRIKLLPQFLRHAPLPDEPIEAILGDNFEFGGEKPLDTVEGLVWELVKGTGKITPKEIFDLKIGSNTSVYEALEKLTAAGKIVKTRRGEYALTKLDKMPTKVV